MAMFSKNTITQVSGFDNPCIAGELVWEQQTYWNLDITASDGITPLDLSTATIDAEIIRRTVTNLQDSRYGLSFDIGNYSPTPSPISLTITNEDPTHGKFTLVINDSTWGLINDDPELDIGAKNCVAFSGRIKISFPTDGTNPANDYIIFLLFLVRSDGIVVE
jgi:hypothetical protein